MVAAPDARRSRGLRVHETSPAEVRLPPLERLRVHLRRGSGATSSSRVATPVLASPINFHSQYPVAQRSSLNLTPTSLIVRCQCVWLVLLRGRGPDRVAPGL